MWPARVGTTFAKCDQGLAAYGAIVKRKAPPERVHHRGRFPASHAASRHRQVPYQEGVVAIRDVEQPSGRAIGSTLDRSNGDVGKPVHFGTAIGDVWPSAGDAP